MPADPGAVRRSSDHLATGTTRLVTAWFFCADWKSFSAATRHPQANVLFDSREIAINDSPPHLGRLELLKEVPHGLVASQHGHVLQEVIGGVYLAGCVVLNVLESILVGGAVAV